MLFSFISHIVHISVLPTSDRASDSFARYYSREINSLITYLFSNNKKMCGFLVFNFCSKTILWYAAVEKTTYMLVSLTFLLDNFF